MDLDLKYNNMNIPNKINISQNVEILYMYKLKLLY